MNGVWNNTSKKWLKQQNNGIFQNSSHFIGQLYYLLNHVLQVLSLIPPVLLNVHQILSELRKTKFWWKLKPFISSTAAICIKFSDTHTHTHWLLTRILTLWWLFKITYSTCFLTQNIFFSFLVFKGWVQFNKFWCDL